MRRIPILCLGIAVIVVIVAQIVGFIKSRYFPEGCPIFWNEHEHMIVTMDLYNNALDDIHQFYINHKQTFDEVRSLGVDVFIAQEDLKEIPETPEDVGHLLSIISHDIVFFHRLFSHRLKIYTSYAQEKRLTASAYEFDAAGEALTDFLLFPGRLERRLKKVKAGLVEYEKIKHVLDEFIGPYKDAALHSEEFENLYESIPRTMEQIKIDCKKLDLMVQGLSETAEQLKASTWVHCSDMKRRLGWIMDRNETYPEFDGLN